ncbi:MAG: hypothetical protein ACAF41_26580 [Leptolyngbya sp. BL-A-14]
MMSPVNQVIQSAIGRGYLTAEAEQTLCQYLNGNCNLHDITALTMLQRALLSGRVKRLSKEQKQPDAL